MQQKLLNLLERAAADEQAFVDGLSGQERAAAGTMEQWSAKDVVVHIAFWKEHQAANVSAALRGETPPRTEDYHQVNAEVFEQNRDRPWADVLDDAERAHNQMVEIVQTSTEEQLAEFEPLPWRDGWSLWRLVAGTAFIHPMIHLAGHYTEHGQIERAIGLQEEAATELAGLDDSPDWQGITRYNLACQYVTAGRTEQAIAGLREALRLNPELTEWSKEDPDFASIRELPAYKAIYEEWSV
jgi:hypothetical protein